MALAAALLGWMFDGLEMGLFPLVAGPAIDDLLPHKQPGDVGFWLGVATAGFLVGAATGGVLFGWLGDRVGRVRAMMLSVFTYAIFSGLCGLAQSPAQITVLRFLSAPFPAPVRYFRDWRYGSDRRAAYHVAWRGRLPFSRQSRARCQP